jgi:hypothetical protein
MLHAQGKKHRNINNTLQLKSHATTTHTTTALSTTNRTTATTDRTTIEGRSQYLTYQVNVSISIAKPFSFLKFCFCWIDMNLWLLTVFQFVLECCCSMLFLSFLILLLRCLFVFYSRVVYIVVKLYGLVSVLFLTR